MNQTSSIDTQSDRIVEILRYIAALQPQDQHADHIADKDRLLDAGAADLPGLSFPAVSDASDAWVRVARVQPSIPPALPDILHPWVVIEDNPNKAPIDPKLRKRIDNPDAPKNKAKKVKKDTEQTDVEHDSDDTTGVYLFLRNLPDIEQAFHEWMNVWNEWAAHETKVRQSAAIYQRLYHIFRDMSADNQTDTRDIVCGTGHVLWNIKDSETSNTISYSYPLILQRCDIRLVDAPDYPLEIWPLGLPAQLHLGRLGDGVSGEAAENFWAQSVSPDHMISPFDQQSFAALVSGVVARLDGSGSLQHTTPTHLPEATNRLTAFPWFTFFQKKRSHNHLLTDLKRLEQSILQAPKLPEILVNLVDRDSVTRLPEKLPAFRGLESFARQDSDRNAKDLYFPLPYNEEQIQVVQRLEASAGVVVQGPPGTGKSHTIANIVSHYLANGQRVLVTSHSAAALVAARDKIPESIRDLTVALLTSETESLADFEKSVREIADRLATFNQSASQRIVDDLQNVVDGLYQQLEKVDTHILEHMRGHHVTHMLKDQPVTLTDLVRFYTQQETAPAWLGRVPMAAPIKAGRNKTSGLMFPSIPSEVDDTIIQSLRQARIDAGSMFPLIFEPISNPASWPREDEVRSVIQAQQRLNKLEQQARDGVIKAKTKPFDEQSIWELNGDVSSAQQHIQSLQEHQLQADSLDASVRYAAHHDETILTQNSEEMASALRFCEDVGALRKKLRQSLSNIVIAQDALHDAEFRQAVARGAKGEPPLGGFFQRFKTNKSLKTWIDDVKISDKSPTNAEDWKQIEEHIQTLDAAQQAISTWGRYALAFGWNDNHTQSIETNKAMVVAGTPSAHDTLKQLEHVTKLADVQLVRGQWRAVIAPAIEEDLKQLFVDPLFIENNTTKSKWTRGANDTTPSIHLRNKPVTEEDTPTKIVAPWDQWDQKTDAEREQALNIAERSLNLWTSIEQEQKYLEAFKKNATQMLDKAKPLAQCPDIPALPIPPKTRQTVSSPIVTVMDKVRQFLETDMWIEPRQSHSDTSRRTMFQKTVESKPKDSHEQRITQWRVLLTGAERLYAASQMAAKPTETAFARLIQAGLGDWVHALIKNPLDNLPNPKRVNAVLPDDDFLPENWKEHIQQAQIHLFLSTIDDQQSLMGHLDQRRYVIQSLSVTLAELAAEKSWATLANGVTPQQRQALTSYLSAVRSVGTGNGKRSARHQQDARQAMSEAFSAVPCWIMPTSKVSETMPSEVGLFDLVVIDEASQSDLAALPALIRGKKILVVGDDKQVSPSNFVQEDIILQQRRTLLANQPFAALMSPDRSIYDLFSGVLPNASIMLREHFRCVEPIISWSNKHYYHDKMVPLRVPSSAQRLDPPLIDILVEDGVMEDDVNKAEAEVIAREIKAISEDPAMFNKTIGVVTLPSKDTQSLKIRDAIDQAISQNAYLRHKILVGPPARFQGSERDIMFVAMTWDGQSGGATDRPEFHQRFNVAMSRARERMILVRSIPNNMLRSGTLLTKVVQHFQDDHIVQKASGIEKCKTDVERDVFQALQDQGYHVQAHVGPRHAEIDLVVEDQSGRRLAIECDGDTSVAALAGNSWETQWEDSTTRQRILERAGWTFLRITAASWYLHPKQTLEKIMTALHDAGIAPNAQEHTARLMVEKRVVRAFPEQPKMIEPAIEEDNIEADNVVRTSRFQRRAQQRDHG